MAVRAAPTTRHTAVPAALGHHARRCRPSLCVTHGPAVPTGHQQWRTLQARGGVACAAADRRLIALEGVESQPSPSALAPARSGPPFLAKAAMALLGVLLAVKAANAWRKRGSRTELLSRGYASQGEIADDKFFEDAMKGMNTVKYEDIPEEVVKAARARRSRERQIQDGTQNLFENLPKDHPFATAEKVSDEEMDLMRQRLEVKRGLPLQDLDGTRGFPDDGKGKSNLM